MVKYRITAKFIQVVVMEGEGDIPKAEERADEISTGTIAEGEDEFSSFRDLKPEVKIEILVDPETDTWGELV